jgi:hypothetical protein
MKKRVGVIVLAIGMLFLLADAAGAGGIWGNGGKPPGRAAAPAGSVWGGNGAPAPNSIIWGGGYNPPKPTGMIWGGGGHRAGWRVALESLLTTWRGLTF